MNFGTWYAPQGSDLVPFKLLSVPVGSDSFADQVCLTDRDLRGLVCLTDRDYRELVCLTDRDQISMGDKRMFCVLYLKPRWWLFKNKYPNILTCVSLREN